jgi:hypothetical protein
MTRAGDRKTLYFARNTAFSGRFYHRGDRVRKRQFPPLATEAAKL